MDAVYRLANGCDLEAGRLRPGSSSTIYIETFLPRIRGRRGIPTLESRTIYEGGKERR